MNPRERTMLIGAIVLLGAIVFYYLIYTPQNAEYATLVQQRDAAQAQLVHDQQILARAAQVQQEYDRLSSFIRTVQSKLPGSKEIPSLLTAMEQLTRAVGVEFSSIRPSPPKPYAAGTSAANGTPAGGQPSGAGGGTAGGAAKPPALQVEQMDVGLSVAGTFGQLVQYLQRLQDFPRLITVSSVNVSPQSVPGQASPKLSVTLQAATYILPVQAGKGH